MKLGTEILDHYNYNFGAIKLNCNIGITVGWLGYFWLSNHNLYQRQTGMYAYHGDLDGGSTQWRTQDPVINSTKTILYHRNDMFPGASGASLIYENFPKAGGLYSGGVNNYEIPSFRILSNRAVRLNEALFNLLYTWSRQ